MPTNGRYDKELLGKKVVFFYKGCPYPAQSGLQRRVLELLRGLSDLGAEVTLLSTHQLSESPWTPDGLAYLKENGVVNVEVYGFRKIDSLSIWLGRLLGKTSAFFATIPSLTYTPIGLRWWFARHLRHIGPALTVVVYSMWDGVLMGARRDAGIRVIDAIDLVSLNLQMRQALELSWTVTAEGFDEFEEIALDEQFYERLRVRPNATEFKIYDRYDYTLAITESETKAIEQQTRKTKVVYLPMTEGETAIENYYDGPALFTKGDNPFNRQAYHYFVHRILPLILERESSFRLEITGGGRKSMSAQRNIIDRGFVADLSEIYSHARLFVCPVFGGTGELIKVVEAMAAGLPAVILQSALHRTPIEHGINGLVARNANEFAQYAMVLWKDLDLCRKLGSAARGTVAERFSRRRLRTTLTSLFSPLAA